tara:strand:+ start:675 stop:1079 length:405 start_codon:yes stop_codon:yes gene_type:complete
VIKVAKATLTEATQQSGGGFITLCGVLLEVDVKTDISVKSGMLYMDSHNITVEFLKSDFKDVSESVLENIGIKLNVSADKVVDHLFPPKKKTVASKAKATLTGSGKAKKPAPKKQEKPAKEEKETASEEEKSDK